MELTLPKLVDLPSGAVAELCITCSVFWDDRNEHGPAGLALDEVISATLDGEELGTDAAVELFGGYGSVWRAAVRFAEELNREQYDCDDSGAEGWL